MSVGQTPEHIKLDERNHVELPLLQQLDGLGWDIVDLTGQPTALAAGVSGGNQRETSDASAFGSRGQKPSDTGRENFTEVILPQVLRSQLIVINDWLEDDQVEQVVKQLTASFPSNSLIENNKHLLHLLLENTSVSENRQTGENSPTVRFVDFKNAANNDFTAVCQFKIRILGTEHHIIPDITLFLNGLPVVVIECKSPKVKDAIPEAIDQLMRYSEQRGAKGEGSQPLFFYNQFLVATCRNQCKFGTITTHTEEYFYRWADPYPRTVDELKHGASAPNDQQRLVAGMLDPWNLLDLIRTFTLFSTDDMLAFKKFTKCLNLVFPAKEALTFMPDYQALADLNIRSGMTQREHACRENLLAGHGVGRAGHSEHRVARPSKARRRS